MNVNRVIVAGNITKDPDLKYLNNGTAVVNMVVATNRKYKKEGGDIVDEPTFVKVVVWGKTAEAVKNYCNKGKAVLIDGRLKTRSWEKDGQKHSVLEIIAERVHFDR